MRKRLKPFIINHGTYPFDILVIIDHDDKEAEEEISKICDLTDEEKDLIKCVGRGRTCMLEGGQTVLRVENDKYFNATVAHEIFHCVDFLFRKIGIQLSENSDEAYAYQIEYLTKQFYEKIRF